MQNLYELQKLAPYRSRIGVLLRLSFRSPAAVVDLSKKFGCMLDEAPDIVLQARKMGLHVKDVRFHVGAQRVNATKHVAGVQACHRLMLQLNDFAACQ